MAGAKPNSRTVPSSLYLDDRFYERLCGMSREWFVAGEAPAADLREMCERLLCREVRLIDDGEFEQWLGLFSRDCAYWIPATRPAGDPRREVTQEFHDRRRLEDRLARIRTGRAYSQVPPTRTCHLLTNLEIVAGGLDEIRARASFAIHTYRLQVYRTLAGWCGYVLVREDNDWKIQVKQINLIDADEGQENNSFFL
jgi:ethylbenzene dioxygenase subunit beta